MASQLRLQDADVQLWNEHRLRIRNHISSIGRTGSGAFTREVFRAHRIAGCRTVFLVGCLGIGICFLGSVAFGAPGAASLPGAEIEKPVLAINAVALGLKHQWGSIFSAIDPVHLWQVVPFHRFDQACRDDKHQLGLVLLERF